MASFKGVVTGAAVGTLLGSLALLLYPKRREIMEALVEQSNGFADKAKDYAQDLFTERRLVSKQAMRNGYATSGLVGALFGAGLALALSPKSGRKLRMQLSNVYRNIFDRTNGFVDILKNHSHPIRNGVSRPHKRKPKRLFKTKP